MSDFELFRGFDQGGEQMDEKAFERFKAQMQANAGQIQLLQKAEKKQKKKEDDLIKILMRFLQSHQKTDIMLLVVKCLEENIPAVFILSLILLVSKEMQKEIGVDLSVKDEMLGDENLLRGSTAIVNFDPRQTVLPLKIKIALDLWGKNIYEVASTFPHKILKTALTLDHKIKLVVVKLTAFTLNDYLQQNKAESEYEKVKQFSEFMLDKIFKQIKKQIDNQKELK